MKPIDIKEQTEILVKLQAIDSGKRQINAMLSSVDGKIQKLDSDLRTSRSIMVKSEKELDDLLKKYRELEAEVGMNIPRIEKSKEKLRSVKNNKEYQSLLKEIEDLKKINSSLEDSMLECLEQIDQFEASGKKRKDEFSDIEEQINKEKKGVTEETQQGKIRLESLNAEWESVSAKVAPEMLRIFDKVRGQSRGITIAPVFDSVCQACNMNIPPQMYNELQRFESLMFCPNCQRIIYWDEK